MKNFIRIIFIVSVIIIYTTEIYAQQGVGINNTGSQPHVSAILDVSSITKGTLITRLTTSQRDSIAILCSCTPAEGLLIFNTTTKCFEAYVNGSWGTVSCPSACAPPAAPVATAASGVQQTQFTANWNSVTGATGYYLDVATDSNFTSFVSGYNNLSVGFVLTYNVTGLSQSTKYYYRVRAENSCGTGTNSNIINTTTSGSSKKVFITSQKYNGNLGGLSGGDAKCQSLATAAGLSGTWKAWLSSGGTSPSTSFTQSSSNYTLIDGTVIASNWADLIDGILTNPINKDEYGNIPPAANSSQSSCNDGIKSMVWTWTMTNGTPQPGSNCSGWTTASGGGDGAGSSTASGTSWTYYCASQCTDELRLYCFEQ